MFMNKSLIILIMLSLIVIPAQANIFDDIRNILTPPQKHFITQDGDPFKAYYDTSIAPLNTAQNINFVSSYMTMDVLRVYVTDYNQNFYIFKNYGTSYAPTFVNQEQNQYVSLTSEQIKDIANMISDNNLDYFEQVKIWAMLR